MYLCLRAGWYEAEAKEEVSNRNKLLKRKEMFKSRGRITADSAVIQISEQFNDAIRAKQELLPCTASTSWSL